MHSGARPACVRGLLLGSVLPGSTEEAHGVGSNPNFGELPQGAGRRPDAPREVTKQYLVLSTMRCQAPALKVLLAQNKYVGVILGLYRDNGNYRDYRVYIGVILGIYRDRDYRAAL